MLVADFLIACIILAVVPGIGVAITISAGLTGSKKKLLACTLGCVLGVIPYMILNFMGAASFLNHQHLLLDIIKAASAIYLIWFSIYIIRSWKLTENILDDRHGNGTLIVKSFLANILNPKIIIFSFGIVPSFLPFDKNDYILAVIIMTSCFMVVVAIAWLLYGLIALQARQRIFHYKKISMVIIKIFATMQIILAIKIITTLNLIK